MLFVVGRLDRASPIGLIDGVTHRIRHPVRVHDDPALRMPGRAARRLDQRTTGAQVALLVRIEDADKRYLGQVQAFAEQVDTNDDVMHSKAKVAKDIDPLQRVDLRVQVHRLHAHLLQIVVEILRHLLRQRRDKRSLVALHALADLVQQVVNLTVRWTDVDLGVKDACRADHLLDHLGRDIELVGTWRGRNEDHLVDVVLELVKPQRAVVEGARKPEPVLHQRPLPREIALVHRAYLGNRDMGLVDEQEPVVREIVEQRPRRGPGVTSGQVARVVLDPRAVPDLAERLQVVPGPLFEPRRLQDLPFLAEDIELLAELTLDRLDRDLEPV